MVLKRKNKEKIYLLKFNKMVKTIPIRDFHHSPRFKPWAMGIRF